MKNGIRVVLIALGIGYGVYSSGESYHEFDSGVFDVEASGYSGYEIESEFSSPIHIELSESSGAKFDAYLMNQTEYQKLEAWMQSDSLEQPQINYMSSWENVSKIDQSDIMIDKGMFYLFIDNTLLGTPEVEGQTLSVNFTLSEKY
ncbi:MAG: hypothetical protein P8M30_16150 [Planctomycetaceae bacterium]|jgi:hypothetical protein|nr:hypothetical protein [Planctomycetaceae bacterium]MDG2390843.1 hypothetical protein [Planctomycetaceae bacterium]